MERERSQTLGDVVEEDVTEDTEQPTDPDPKDDIFEATMIYLIRENGKLRIEHDSHVIGLFSLNLWKNTNHIIGDGI